MDPTDAAEVQQNFFLNNPIPMWTYDLDTLAFLEVNRAAEQHYGYSRSEFLSMTIADIRPPDDLPALKTIPGSIRTHVRFRIRVSS